MGLTSGPNWQLLQSHCHVRQMSALCEDHWKPSQFTVCLGPSQTFPPSPAIEKKLKKKKTFSSPSKNSLKKRGEQGSINKEDTVPWCSLSETPFIHLPIHLITKYLSSVTVPDIAVRGGGMISQAKPLPCFMLIPRWEIFATAIAHSPILQSIHPWERDVKCMAVYLWEARQKIRFSHQRRNMSTQKRLAGFLLTRELFFSHKDTHLN